VVCDDGRNRVGLLYIPIVYLLAQLCPTLVNKAGHNFRRRNEI